MKLRYFLLLLFYCSCASLFSQSLSQSLSQAYVHFDVDKHHLDATAQSELNDLFLTLESHSDFELQIIGHTDQDGSEHYNQKLAENRASEVHEYLVAMGMSEQKIVKDWKGETELLVSDNSASAKQKNRRVELQYRTRDYTTIDDLTTAMGESEGSQKYTCDQQQSQLFDLKNGSSVYVPKGAFVYMDGSEITGAVELEFTEAFSYVDIVANKLSTETKDELLETGGMMNITASVDGKEVMLDENRSLELIFPVQKEEEGMEVFYGVEDEDGIVSWEASGQAVSTTQVKNEPLMIDLSMIVNYDFGEIVEPKIEFEKIPARPRQKAKPYPPSDKLYSIDKYNELYENYEKNLQAYYDNKPAEEKALADWQMEVTRRVNRIEDYKKELTEFNYSVKLVNIVKRLDRMEGRRAPSELLTSLFSFMNKPYRIRLNHKEAYRKAFGNYTREVIDDRKLDVYQDEHHISARNNFYPDLKGIIFDAQKRADQERYARTGQISSRGLSSYVMGISKLGWINCDRFRQSSFTSKLTVVSGSDYQNTRYYMIFKDIRSVLSGKRLVGMGEFKNVPVGEDVKLVAVKLIDDRPYLASKDHTIGQGDIVKLDFRPTTLNQIKDELNSLDPTTSAPQTEELELSVTMYPNPTSESFSVTAEPQELLSEIGMYSMAGELVKTIKSDGLRSNNELVSVADIADGIYVVSARYSNGEIATERIVVQK